MITTVLVLGCSAKKLRTPAPARELYRGALFRKALAWGEARFPGAAALVLSAKLGIVEIDRVIEPYDLSLNGMSSDEREAWGRSIERDLRSRFDVTTTRFIVCAGSKYCRPFARSPLVEYPMKNLPLGRALKFFGSP